MFSHAYRQFACLLWRNVYSSPFPDVQLGSLPFYCWAAIVLYTWGIRAPPHGYMTCKYVPLWGFSFHSLECDLCKHKGFGFHPNWAISISPVTVHVFGAITIQPCQIQRHVDVSLRFLLWVLAFSSYWFVGWSFTLSGGIFVEALIRFLPFLVYWVCLSRKSVGVLSDGVSAAIETIRWLLPCSLTMLFVR